MTQSAKNKHKNNHYARQERSVAVKTKSPVASRILCTVLVLAGFLCFFSARWYVSVYGRTGFDSILFTLRASLGGVQSGLISSYLLRAGLPALLSSAFVMTLLIHRPLRRAGHYQSTGQGRSPLWPVSLLLFAALTVFAAFDSELVGYLVSQTHKSDLFETYFVDPKGTKITFPEKKRNLVYIMLESMETTYLSRELGGAMDENLIPELYALAQDNLSFSDSEQDAGGFYTAAGATWTIGAMVAQTAGIPLKTPTADVNKYGAEGEAFLPGVTTLTNILHDAGYYQALMVGSDVRFGGRDSYFRQHQMDTIYDFYTARRDGIIPRDYFVWWGMEDLHLFDYARQELTKIAAQDQPFAFTMLTVDTHHVGGYQCALCKPSASGETYDQSISCSSRQVADFVAWLQQQPFYENTTVVIIGDHESMDNGYMSRNVGSGYQRLVYNCFLNSAAEPVHTKNREFTAVDLFPTTLAAIGCRIDGDRLGLGTNLYSALPTLTERLGFPCFNSELAKASNYYKEHFFAPEDTAQ